MKALALLLAACAAALPALPVRAQPAAPEAAQAAEPTSGEVRRVDREAGKVTLRHGPIANLDMPAMTMVFQVRDRALLEGVKPGDAVRFRAVLDNGSYVVTDLQPAR